MNLGKIFVNDVHLAKFPKVFPHQNFALYGKSCGCVKELVTLDMHGQTRSNCLLVDTHYDNTGWRMITLAV